MPSIITPHFLIHEGRIRPRLGSDEISNELAGHIAAELGPLGLVPDGPAFERVFVDTVQAAHPDPTQAWNLFYGNTMRRLRRPDHGGTGSVATFARIYDHVLSLIRGTTVLDVGSCFGFLPLLAADRDPRLRVVGTDTSRRPPRWPAASPAPAAAAPASPRPTCWPCRSPTRRWGRSSRCTSLSISRPKCPPGPSRSCAAWPGTGWWSPCRWKRRRTPPSGTYRPLTLVDWPGSASTQEPQKAQKPQKARKAWAGRRTCTRPTAGGSCWTGAHPGPWFRVAAGNVGQATLPDWLGRHCPN